MVCNREIMVSHSSSASLSSFHYSHTSSSSPSSPPSSPDYLPSSSQESFGASSSSSVLVPFLWEEKPGVLKKGMQIGDGDDNPSRARHALLSCDTVHGRAHAEDSNAASSERQFSTPRSKMRSNSVPGVPRLRPPPRLSQPSVHACVHTDEDTDILHPHRNQCGSSSGVKSKALSSFPFHKRRHHRIPSLEDDPFWMAMVACTNDAGRSSRMRCKGNRDVDSGEIQSSDSWLVKRVQGHTVDFKQCMPRQRFIGSTVSNRGRSLSCSRRSVLESEAASHKGEIMATSTYSSKDTTHAHNQQDRTETVARSAHLTRKAFKALDIAKSELHGRRKLLLQPQSPPVDISCTTRLCRKPHFSSRRNLADLFGCKSDYPFIIP